VKVALVVGTVLALINHYDALFHGTLTNTDIFQILLTYLVPYAVSTFGSASEARHIELTQLRKIEKEFKELKRIERDSQKRE
jgi:hypothetical protein